MAQYRSSQHLGHRKSLQYTRRNPCQISDRQKAVLKSTEGILRATWLQLLSVPENRCWLPAHFFGSLQQSQVRTSETKVYTCDGTTRSGGCRARWLSEGWTVPRAYREFGMSGSWRTVDLQVWSPTHGFQGDAYSALLGWLGYTLARIRGYGWSKENTENSARKSVRDQTEIWYGLIWL